MPLWVVGVLCVVTPIFGEGFAASFVDPGWNGDKVLEGQQCGKFGGEGTTPTLAVSGIPEGAYLLVLEVSERSFAAMDNGGHGKVGFEIAVGAGSVEVPSAPGHTTDLPAGFVVVAEHQAPTWDTAGAYLSPCSGGRGNEYYVTVKAVASDGGELEDLASAVLEMGTY